jgi:hypothetical protein
MHVKKLLISQKTSRSTDSGHEFFPMAKFNEQAQRST